MFIRLCQIISCVAIANLAVKKANKAVLVLSAAMQLNVHASFCICI